MIFCQFEDHNIVVDPSDLVGKTVLDKGDFDRLRTNIVSRRASELTGRRTVLEVGGNIGTQTIYFLKSGLFDKVVCLEPDPKNARALETNLLINRLEDQVVLLQVAAGAAPDILRLKQEEGNSGAATLRADKLPQKRITEIEVPVITLDSLIADGTLDCADVGLLWVDTEGYEEEIFAGASVLLAKKIPLAFELSPHFYNPQQSAQIIKTIFSIYDEVSLVDDKGFRKISRADMAKLKTQADVFCC